MRRRQDRMSGGMETVLLKTRVSPMETLEAPRSFASTQAREDESYTAYTMRGISNSACWLPSRSLCFYIYNISPDSINSCHSQYLRRKSCRRNNCFCRHSNLRFGTFRLRPGRYSHPANTLCDPRGISTSLI